MLAIWPPTVTSAATQTSHGEQKEKRREGGWGDAGRLRMPLWREHCIEELSTSLISLLQSHSHFSCSEQRPGNETEATIYTNMLYLCVLQLHQLFYYSCHRQILLRVKNNGLHLSLKGLVATFPGSFGFSNCPGNEVKGFSGPLSHLGPQDKIFDPLHYKLGPGAHPLWEHGTEGWSHARTE